MRVFIYGPLRFPEVMQLFSGSKLASVKAVLKNFACRRFKDQQYPGIVSQEAAETAGLLIDNVDHALLKRLDSFVGDKYFRQNMMVKNEMGRMMLAAVYLTKPDSCRALSDDPWDAEAFRCTGLPAYVEDLRKSLPA
jgi:gamma-glutamylcyclotransferase (GGCT)/AIG2-like uncharacterized protein YtfP